MGRERQVGKTVQVHIFMLASLHDEMILWGKDHGWTKTKIIEHALSYWLNQRHLEVKHEVAKTGQ